MLGRVWIWSVALVMLMLGGSVAPAAEANKLILDRAEHHKADALKLWERLVNIDSGTGDAEGLKEVSAIVIEQLPTTTAPTEKIVNDRRGVMGWTFDLAPNASKDILLAYRMKWPADREVVFQSAPNGPSTR